MKFMLRRATYWNSGSDDTREMRGAASFLITLCLIFTS